VDFKRKGNQHLLALVFGEDCFALLDSLKLVDSNKRKTALALYESV